MTEPKMYYFGAWDRPGHFYYVEGGARFFSCPTGLPWTNKDDATGIDGCLQPGCYYEKGIWSHTGKQIQGPARIHHKDGWTALSFWDRSVDGRGSCNSTYFAEGIFDFEQMIKMAKERFSYRWNKMSFTITEYKQ